MKKQNKNNSSLKLTTIERASLLLNIPLEENVHTAEGIKQKFSKYLKNNDYLAMTNYLIKDAQQIDAIFGAHTSEELLQFVW